jgi:3-methyladenine DNA glycosylase/8-oxoguanine DNA glycosylase
MPTFVAVDPPRSLRSTLSAYRSGIGDPTTQLTDHQFLRATFTPDGPGTLRLTWVMDPAPISDAEVVAEAWGPGAGWLLERVNQLTGVRDQPVRCDDGHPIVERALRLTGHRRIGASPGLYHLLLPMIIAQRITAGEALKQWQRLVWKLGEPAPGPVDVVANLRLPPSPETLVDRPAWWFHPLGIEAKRARTLTEVARHANKFWAWAEAGSQDAGSKLALIPGVGPWTVGSVLGPAFGDPDAVAVGDFHFPNIVAWALVNEPRATDERMLELLQPYRGQRGRVLSAIVSTAGKPPAFGPRKRIVPIARL